MTEEYRSPETKETSQSPAVIIQSKERPTQVIQPVYFISTIMLIIAVINSITEYLNFGSWQILADAGFVISGLLVLMFSFRLYRRGSVETAFELIPVVIFLAYAPGELFLEGVTFYNSLTGVMLFGLGWSIFKPQNSKPWLIFGAAFLAFEFVFSLVRIFPRFDISLSPSWPASLPILSGVLAILFIWQILSTIRLRTIQSRMLVSLIGLAMIPALVIGFTTALLGFQGSLDQIGNNIESISRLKTTQINNWLSQVTSDLNSLQQKSSFVDNVRVLPFFAQETYYHLEIQADLTDVMENSGNFNNIYIIGPEGSVILSMDRQLNDVDLSASELFIQGWEGIYILPATFNPATGELSIQIARPIVLEDGEVVAVLVGDLYTPKLLEITADRTNLGETGETYLVSQDSTLLTPLRNSENLLPGRDMISTQAINQQADDITFGSMQYDSYENRTVIGTAAYFPELGASMFTEQEQTEANSAINFALTLDVIISIIALVGATSFAVVLTRNISIPIRDLSETASQVSKGELESLQPIDRDDEIGELSRSLSEMTNQILQT